MKSERSVKNRKRTLLLGAAVLLVIAAGLGYWKRRGICNTWYRIAGIEVPRNITSYGYYGQAVKIKQDLHDYALISEDDQAAEETESNIPVVSSLISRTEQIDAMITTEQENGAYPFEDPMVILDPFQISPLTGIVLFSTEEPAAVRCTVKGKTRNADISYETPAAIQHRVPLIGLYPAAENTVILELSDENGDSLSRTELKVTTSGLPESMQDMVIPVTTGGASAYELTMVYGQKCLYPFAYDCNGDVRWYLAKETGFYGVYNLSDGHFILQDPFAYVPSCSKPQTAAMYEMDYLGRAYKLYYVSYGVHHEVIEKEPGGNLLCLSSSMEEHYEDVILELDRESGEAVNSLKLSDLFVNTYTRKLDWAHLNTVSYQPDDDTILISARNVHSVMKIGWTDHQLKWILCDPAFWEGKKQEILVLQPEGDILWHYQQHTAYRTEADLDGDPSTLEISIFDNHIDKHRKVKTFTDTGKSYVTVYSVNEEKGTVSVAKQLEVEQSDICSLTVYDKESGHIFGMSGIISKDTYQGYRGMNYEFDYVSGEIVNQFAIRDQFYRASRMPVVVESMCEALPTAGNSIVGNLVQPQLTKKKVSGTEGSLTEKVTLSRMGSVLFLNAKNRHISQVIFRGGNHTYVYDNTGILLEKESYTDFTANLPVAVQNLEPDTYHVLCVYEDRLYQLTCGGEDAFITVKE